MLGFAEGSVPPSAERETPAEVARRRSLGSSPTQVKVVVGNKKMMAQEDVIVSPAVDDYMREMEVRSAHWLNSGSALIALSCASSVSLS
jgi:hypothetical protein